VFDVDIVPVSYGEDESLDGITTEVRVLRDGPLWRLLCGDFDAEWDPRHAPWPGAPAPQPVFAGLGAADPAHGDCWPNRAAC
jgi:hypothetical protein